jgi:hypothetical protein
MTDDVEKGIAVGSKSNPILISLTEYEGQRLLDIRRYYLEKGTKQLKPTKKGISLPLNAAKAVLDVLLASRDKVLAWLDKPSDEFAATAAAAMATRAAAREREARQARYFQVESESRKEAAFFSVVAHGATDILTLNESHPVFEALQASSPSDAKEILRGILVAYARTKTLFADRIEADSATFFEMFEHEWGLMLKQYCRR